MAKLLVTGATGMLGMNLLEHGASGFDEIHTLGRRAPKVDIDTPLRFHECDLLDDGARNAVVQRVAATHVCHLAWVGADDPDRYHSPANRRFADMTGAFAAEAAAAGATRFVFVGSCIEYGNASGVFSEDSPADPDNEYGRQKLRAGQLAQQAATATCSVAVARPFFIYGRHEAEQRLVPAIITGVRKGERVALSEGRQRRDYLCATDVATALAALLHSDASGIFNIGAGESIEVRALAQTVGEILGRTDLLGFGERPGGADTAAEITADITRITHATDWRPTTSLREGLSDMIDWYSAREEVAT